MREGKFTNFKNVINYFSFAKRVKPIDNITLSIVLMFLFAQSSVIIVNRKAYLNFISNIILPEEGVICNFQHLPVDLYPITMGAN